MPLRKSSWRRVCSNGWKKVALEHLWLDLWKRFEGLQLDEDAFPEDEWRELKDAAAGASQALLGKMRHQDWVTNETIAFAEQTHQITGNWEGKQRGHYSGIATLTGRQLQKRPRGQRPVLIQVSSIRCWKVSAAGQPDWVKFYLTGFVVQAVDLLY